MPARDHRGSVVKACPPLAGRLLAGSIILLAVLVPCRSGWAEALQWQRSADSGVRWLTSHLCHWSWNHLIWDLSAFGLLSLLSLRVAPSRYVVSLLAAAVLIPLEIRINQPALESYRGLSGIDCALFGLIAAALWQQPSGDRKGVSARTMAVLGGGGFLAKTLYELTTGGTLFVEAGPELFVPAISAHLVGFLTGLGVGLTKTDSRVPACPPPRYRPAPPAQDPGTVTASTLPLRNTSR